MKRRHMWFETSLLFISAIMGLGSFISSYNPGFYFSSDITVLAMIWLLILGILQIIHSLVIAFVHWQQIQIRRYLVGYWIGAAISLCIAFGAMQMGYNTNMEFFTLIVLPFFLAIRLWYITYKFRKMKPQHLEGP